MPNPAVPFMGIYQTELTHLEDGNPDYIEGKNGKKLINYAKRRLFSETIFNIQLYQQTPYNFVPIPFLQYVLREEIYIDNWDDNKKYSQSLILEPRNKK